MAAVLFPMLFIWTGLPLLFHQKQWILLFWFSMRALHIGGFSSVSKGLGISPRRVPPIPACAAALRWGH